MEKENTIKLVSLLIVGVLIVMGAILIIDYYKPWEFSYSEEPKQFNSAEEFSSFIKSSQIRDESGRGMDGLINTFTTTKASFSEAADSGASDFSKTNIQVEGVDEADIVKNDGKYIYQVINGRVIIVEAYPANSLEILSEINISGIRDIFINKEKLIMLSQDYANYYGASESQCVSDVKGGCVYPDGYSTDRTRVYIYDVSDRESPELVDDYSIEGDYVESRMIGDYVYIISSKYLRSDIPEPPIYVLNGVEKRTPIEDIYYFDYPDESYVFTSINAIKISNGEFNSKIYLTGYTGTVYVSQDNIFLTHTKIVSYKEYNDQLIKEVYLKILPSEKRQEIEDIWDSSKQEYEKMSEIRMFIYNYSNSLEGEEKAEFDQELLNKTQKFDFEIRKRMEKTVVHKIGVDKLDIEYRAAGEVMGHLLNQFSMDEYDGYFRVATTTGEVWSGNSLNHIFVLDEDMDLVGSIEDIAKGEKIYSARFLGKRAYLVTFKKVDPFFVIDLSNPRNPKILGYLKIPGYSDYLHPYDENHVIGIGKEAVDASEEQVAGRNLDFAWYQGVKIALFDVSDVENPKEKAKFVIGDRGTDSLALQEHKAFLFDKEKNLLVIPINLAIIDRSRYTNEEDIPPTAYGEHVWQGAYVLNINTNGISLRGRITHNEDNNQSVSNRYYGYHYNTQVIRTLYMDNVLYTISNSKIKANDLETVEELNSLKLPSTEMDYPVYY